MRLMISYEYYKLLHVISVVIFIVFSSIMLWNKQKNKIASILVGITSLTILVSGMGLLARLGIKHAEGWPLWATVKLFIWLALVMAVPMVLKRKPQLSKIVLTSTLILFSVAAFLAIFKIV